MKFINVSNENMAITEDYLDGDKEIWPGVFTDPWQTYFIECPEPNVIKFGWDCCWDCFGSATVYNLVDEFQWTAEEKELFFDWYRDIENEHNPADLTWDFALNVGTDYTN